MKKIYFLNVAFSLFVLLLCSGKANADACPQGMITNPVGAGGQPQCIPGANHQGWGGTESSKSSYARRWGAFAADPISAKLGIASGLSTKRKAEKEALKHCQGKGGIQCEAFFTYYNQCGAVAWGPDRGVETGETVAASAATKEQAVSDALNLCGKNSDRCKIVSAECSYAERT